MSHGIVFACWTLIHPDLDASKLSYPTEVAAQEAAKALAPFVSGPIGVAAVAANVTVATVE